MQKLRFGGSGRKVIALLGYASWFLLGVSWVMSIYAYPRLPQDVALWTGLLSADAAKEARSLAFFVFPLAQTFFFLVFLGLAKSFFFPFPPGPDSRETVSRAREAGLRLDLKKEVVYLGLIFLNLVFIHLQTTLILVSHGLAQGMNRFYLAVLLLVLLMLFPYYRIRRKMLDAGSPPE
jgi:hypothetical protein